MVVGEVHHRRVDGAHHPAVQVGINPRLFCFFKLVRINFTCFHMVLHHFEILKIVSAFIFG